MCSNVCDIHGTYIECGENTLNVSDETQCGHHNCTSFKIVREKSIYSNLYFLKRSSLND